MNARHGVLPKRAANEDCDISLELDAPAIADAPTVRMDFQPEIDEVVRKLHGTADVVLPAVRADKSRRFLSWISRNAIKICLVLSAAVLVQSVAIVGLAWFAVHPFREYFATDRGRLFPLIPLGRPYRKPADVIQYAKETLERSFTLDFNNWRQQLEDVRYRYDTEGFKSLIAAMQQSGILAAVRERRMNMSITTGTGVLVKEGVENGVYTWYVEAPIEIKLAGQTTDMPSQRFKATVRIDRSSTLDNIEGIEAAQVITKPN